MDAGAVELELVLTGLKKLRQHLKQFSRRNRKKVKEFAAYNKAAAKVDLEKRINKQFQALGLLSAKFEFKAVVNRRCGLFLRLQSIKRAGKF